jgi:flagellar basal body rod protein FlgC
MNAMGIGALGLLAAGAKLFSSASNVALATSFQTGSEPPFLPLQSVQAAARSSGVGASTRRGFANPVIKWPVQPWEMGISWSAGDLTGAFIGLSEAANAFKANLAIIRTADEMQKALIDLKT